MTNYSACNNRYSRLVVQIHDELLFEAPNEDVNVSSVTIAIVCGSIIATHH